MGPGPRSEQKRPMETTIRPWRATDAAECGRTIYAAFTDIADRHMFSRPFPSPKVATGLATMRLSNPGFNGVVAEEAGNIVGSNFIYLSSPWRARPLAKPTH